MGTLQEEIAFFRTVGARAENNVRGTLYEQVEQIKNTIQSKAPVRTGLYKSSWTVRKGGNSSMIASASIFNPLIYASAIDLGINKGSMHPWAVAKRRKTAPNLVVSAGKVWSSQAPGGTLHTTVTPSFEKSLSQELANAVIGALR